MSGNRIRWTVLCERRKSNFSQNIIQMAVQWTVLCGNKKNYFPFVFKSIVCVEYWCKKEEITFYFLILYSNRHEQLSVDVKRRKYFHSQLNIWQLSFPIWSKENLLFHSWQKRHCMGSQGVKRKTDFFITNLTKQRLLYRYEVKRKKF